MGRKKSTVKIDPRTGERIKEAYDALGMTQAEAADQLLSMYPQAFNPIINGKRRLTPENAKRIAEECTKRGYEITAAYLLCESEYRNIGDEFAHYAREVLQAEEREKEWISSALLTHGLSYEFIPSVLDRINNIYKIHFAGPNTERLHEGDYYLTALDFEEFLMDLTDLVHTVIKEQIEQLLTSPKVARSRNVNNSLKERTEAHRFLLSFIENMPDDPAV